MTDATFWLLVGLGNPGPEHAMHRHNLGFMATEAWVSERDALAGWRDKWSARTTTIRTHGSKVVVLQPQTYMNRSGRSVAAAATFHKVPPAQILVVHDELDFDFGRVAVKNGGGHGGHNGLRDIVAALGSRDFPRVRVGVGRSPHGREPTSWLLSDFSREQAVELPAILERAAEAVSAVLTQGPRAAQNSINRPDPRSKPSEPDSSREDP